MKHKVEGSKSMSSHQPHFSSEGSSASNPFLNEDSYSILYEESHSPQPSYSGTQLTMGAQGWVCQECGFENNYISDECVKCHHPTPNAVIEAQTQFNYWRN